MFLTPFNLVGVFFEIDKDSRHLKRYPVLVLKTIDLQSSAFQCFCSGNETSIARDFFAILNDAILPLVTHTVLDLKSKFRHENPFCHHVQPL